MKKSLTAVKIFVLLVPWLTILFYFFYPSGKTVYAASTLKIQPVSVDDWKNSLKVLNLRRSIQKHFLRYDIYLPLEDIIAYANTDLVDEKFYTLMKKSCGQASLAVWLPLRFNVPYYGEKIFEWCWKPKITNLRT